jgi:hypothetical protein
MKYLARGPNGVIRVFGSAQERARYTKRNTDMPNLGDKLLSKTVQDRYTKLR